MPPGIFQNIVLAILQGFTEIFPISSSGHLAVYGKVWGQDMSFDRVILFHLGTFLAILYFYRKDVIYLITGRAGWKLPGLMLMSFGITALTGFVIKGTLADSLVEQPQYVTVLWLINGLILILVGVVTEPGFKKMSELGVKEYVIIGVAQGVAALPGISRLGLTLGAGLLQKMTWFEALKLSFLLSLPTILMANLSLPALQVLLHPTIPTSSTSNPSLTPVLDILIALITLGCGLLALYFLSRFLFLGRRLLRCFGLYCMVAGFFFLFYLNLL